MKEARYFYVPQAIEKNELPAEEAAHALRVLRLKPGDELFLMDGEGVFYEAYVTQTDKHCYYQIEKALPQPKTWSAHIHLGIAPTKMMERIEWLAEKATEIGFDELSFLHCKFSERKTLRADRVEKIVIYRRQNKAVSHSCLRCMSLLRSLSLLMKVKWDIVTSLIVMTRLSVSTSSTNLISLLTTILLLFW